ncbi:MAG: response regulator [Cyanobacteria bacterium J06632_22]
MASILIVEDEAQIAAFMAKGLERAGYQTEIATDGHDALALVQAVQFDLVLLDLGLPGLDGWSVMVQILAQAVHPPIIIVTAVDGVDERQRCLNLGAVDYIIKPFRFSDLLASVRRHFPA